MDNGSKRLSTSIVFFGNMLYNIFFVSVIWDHQVRVTYFFACLNPILILHGFGLFLLNRLICSG